MNGTRLLLSLLLVALPAAALPLVRTTRRPQAWARVLAVSLGAGFVLVEVSLIHAALPLAFTLAGLDQLAEACRTLGGHLFGGAVPFNTFAAGLAILVGFGAVRGVVQNVRTNSELRRGSRRGISTPIAGHQAVVLPLQHSWAVAVPGDHPPQVLLSPNLISALEHRELGALVRHEMAHLRHHHVRYLLLGTVAIEGLWFIPGRKRAARALRLALERWADESASGTSNEDRTQVVSALHKLASLAPSALAAYRIEALQNDADENHREWGWATVASATVPLALALAATLIMHLQEVIRVAGAG